MFGRRAALLAGLGLAVPAAARTPRGVWFDPTQLPSYSGRLDRWIANPAGGIDRGLFREGSQFVFPAGEAELLQAAIEPGGPLTVWGIRARSAPVITMLAWAARAEDPALFVERPLWLAPLSEGRERHEVHGKVHAALLTPQGEPMGVVLDQGGAVHLDPAIHRALGNRLAAGQSVAASGLGARVGELVAIRADALGSAPGALAPLPAPAP
jgi:hypothetical protein